jgi:FixJ family two-component response regulator
MCCFTQSTRHWLVAPKGNKKNGNRLAIAERIGNLTDREREIVKRVALGQTNPAIADALGIALRTVKLHRQRGFEKLGVTSVVELVRITDNAGL